MNQTHSVNLSNNSTDHKLINFCVPNHFIQKFDNLLKVKRVSRTSVLLRLMETFYRYELKQMEDDSLKFNKVINDISNDNHKPNEKHWRRKEEYEPPMIPLSSDFDDDVSSDDFWTNRLK